MKKANWTLLAQTMCIITLAFTITGCSKKVAAQSPMKLAESAPPAAPPPAPTLSLSVSPSAITKGQTTTLSWNSSHSADVKIDNGIGEVAASGSRVITPSISTTFTATATGPGGGATASTRITVAEPSPATAPPPPALTDSEFFGTKIKDIFFDFDKYNIRQDAQATLGTDDTALGNRPSIRFTIEGHCDDRGSEKYNLALGDRRAVAAKQWLESHGVSADRIDTISYGKERPFCTDDNDACWQKNRTDHFVMKNP